MTVHVGQRTVACRAVATALAGLGLALLTACSGPVTGAVVPVAQPARSSTGYYVDPGTPAAAQVARWLEEGRTDDAERVRRIAEQPLPLWVTGDAGNVRAQVAQYVARAVAAGARPLLVAYNIPHRDCGSFSGGGAPDGGYYRSWVSGIAAAVDGAGATVVLEPDAVPHELSGCVDGDLRDERYTLLGDAIDVLKAAGATVYLDAGNPGFIGDVDALANALDRSGVRRADGFSLNVANFRTIEENVAYGAAVSDRTGGVHFVIDTSRSGAGAPGPADIGGAPSFCNPPGRALGPVPTEVTGMPRVDALLWVKRPGESDGACRPGEPEAGRWYPDYALDLVERAAS